MCKSWVSRAARMTKAIDIFTSLESGINDLSNAADIYMLHIISSFKKTDVPLDVIYKILNENRKSGYNFAGNIYTAEELQFLNENSHLKAIGQQIVVAIHTALETYLIEKFREYFYHILKGKDEKLINHSFRQLRFRGTKDIKSNYWEMLNIHLPSFDIEYHSTDHCQFKPYTSWEAIKLIYSARNEIVHEGESNSYKIPLLSHKRLTKKA